MSTLAGKILNINKKKINQLYLKMPIKSVNDLKIDGDEIINILNISPSKTIKIIIDDLLNLVLNGKLVNDEVILKQFIIQNKGKWLK